ncbi:MAG: hypothetical protein HYZ58_13810, partial [Acidobacteria bacterium]|nr:hypothetical protein [Acidobacteriota bacterium]
ARFQGRQPALARDLVDAACQSYFLTEAAGSGAPEPWIHVSPGGVRSAPSKESERLINEIVNRAAAHSAASQE